MAGVVKMFQDFNEPNKEITGILINPHFCSLEEFKELIEYLHEKKWDFKFVEVYK